MPIKKTAPKKTAPAKVEKPASSKPTSTRPTSTNKLVEQLRAKLQNVQGNKGDGKKKFNWIKLQAREDGRKQKHLIRIVEPSNGPVMIVYKRQGNGKQGSGFRSAVDLKMIVADEEIQEAMIDRKAIDLSDVKLVKKYGDPFDVLFKALRDQGREKMFRNAQIGSKRTLVVAFKDGEFGIMDRGITFSEDIIDLLEEFPDLLDWEKGTWLSISVTGSGKNTKYSSFIPGESGPIEMEVEGDEDPTTPNLYDVLAYQTLNYVDKVKFLYENYPKLVRIASLDPDDFGLDDEDLESFNYGENKKRSKSKKDYEDVDDEDEEDDEEEDEDDEEYEEDEDEDE